MFALAMITGVRAGAAASLRLKHINLVDGYVCQDGREENTRGGKTTTAWFSRRILTSWPISFTGSRT